MKNNNISVSNMLDTSSNQVMLVINKADLKELFFEFLDEHTANLKFEDKTADEMLPVDEVCKIFNTSKPTLWRWAKGGILKKIKVGGRVFYRRSEVENVMIGKGNGYE